MEIEEKQSRSIAELITILEALIFVADEPISAKVLAHVLEEDTEFVQSAIEELAQEYEERKSGLMLREIAGGWQISTRTEYHEEVRRFLKTRPSAKLSLASLETLAVIARRPRCGAFCRPRFAAAPASGCRCVARRCSASG